MPEHDVMVGDVWEDNDPREQRKPFPRRVYVLDVRDGSGPAKLGQHNPHALVENIQTGRKTEIRLDRFRPNRNGYKLVQRQRRASEIARSGVAT